MRARWIVGAIALGLAIGVGSAVAVIDSGGVSGRQNIDGWRYDPLVGSAAAGSYTRAIVARSGLLALTKSETIYFVRARDEHGHALSADCAYRVSGGQLPSRWWSVTIYAADNFLPVNGDNAESMDATRVHKNGEGGWSVRVAPSRGGAADWVSSRRAGAFDLQLRLYNPAAAALTNPKSIAFPTIETIGCAGARP